MYKCCYCGGTSSFLPEMRVKRDSDGIDIWRCSLCSGDFKIDPHEYLKNKSENRSEVITTYKIGKGFIQSWWWLIFVVALIILGILGDGYN